MSEPDVAAVPSEPDAATAKAEPSEADVAAAAPPGEEAAAEETPEREIRRTVAVRRGDTLEKILVGAGVSRPEAHAAIGALRHVYNPRRLRPGQEITLRFGAEGDAEDVADEVDSGSFVGLRLAATRESDIAVARNSEEGFLAWTVKKELTRQSVRAESAIRSSLYRDGARAGVAAPLLAQMVRVLSYDVDFQREIRQGDSFEIMFGRLEDAKGQFVRYDGVDYAAVTLRGEKLRVYRYTPSDGSTDYFNERGESVRKALMRTPVDGARLTSGFGRRRHPTMGYTRMHRGVDFGAPVGTPIMAAGNGVIERVGWWGAYGRYIRIRHNSEYSTAYAHLRRYAKGLRRGKRVKQGQIIGYVGASGRVTGPHLHYEVLRNGRQINPQKLKLPAGRRLRGRELERFLAARDEIDNRFASLAPRTQVASSE